MQKKPSFFTPTPPKIMSHLNTQLYNSTVHVGDRFQDLIEDKLIGMNINCRKMV